MIQVNVKFPGSFHVGIGLWTLPPSPSIPRNAPFLALLDLGSSSLNDSPKDGRTGPQMLLGVIELWSCL